MTGLLYFYNEDTEQEFELEIDFNYYYDSGMSYYSNGDVGYPAEESADITKIHNEDKIPSWITEDMIDKAFSEQLVDLLEDNEPAYED